MKKFLKTALIPILFGVAAIGNSALAQVNSGASVRITGYQLIDLDLNDGISADIRFFGTRNSAFASVLTGDFSDGFSSSATRNASSDRAIAVSVGGASAGAAASYAGGTFGALAGSGQANEMGNYNSAQNFNTSFTLSPKTLLIILGGISGTANSGVSFAENASSNASVSLSGNLTPDGSGFQNASIGGNASSFYFSNFDQFNKSFALSFINGNTEALTGNYSASASTSGFNGDTPAPAVPEPETYAMMLAGLSILAAVARRRRQKQA